MNEPRSERSLGELFGELSQNTSTLIRQELVLARTEMMQKASQVGRDTAFIGVGGAVLYAALLGVMAALMLLLVRLGMAPWLAVGVVAVVFGIVGAVLVQTRLQALRRQQLKPVQTIESVKETAQWLKNETH